MLGTQKDKDMYMRKLAMDLAFAIRFFGAPDKIVFTMDDYSWRKSVDIDQNEGYKANRVRDDSAVDWDAFNEINVDFFNILQERGFISSLITGCEGDDLMYFWSKKFFDAGEDTVIFSGDGDITQLSKFNNKNFICVFNTKSTSRQIIGAPGFGDWLKSKADEPVDIFDALMDSDFVPSAYDSILKVINTTKLLEVNPDDVLFDKIISGDGGDNIPAIATWQTTQKTGKIINNKISGSKADVIKEKILLRGDGIDVNNLAKYATIFSKSIKEIYDKDFDAETIKKRLERNTILVKLSHDTIPLGIQNLFEKHYIKYQYHGAPNLSKMDMQSLLEGSKYWSGPISVDADIFATATPKNIKQNNPSKSLF
jgi:5'-3' exonuclease